MSTFFFHELQLTTVLLLIRDSYMGYSRKFVSLKACVGYSFFDFVSFLLKFMFLKSILQAVFLHLWSKSLANTSEKVHL